MSKPSILIVDDDLTYVETLVALLKKDLSCKHISHPDEIRTFIKKNPIDVILLDIRFDGKDIGIDYIQEFSVEYPVIMLTSHDDLDVVVETVKRGAHDYFQKDLRVEILKNKIEKCLATTQLRNRYAQTVGEFLGSSEAAKRIRREIQTLSKINIPVLITGETGVGKTLIARLIHANSPWAGKEMQVLAGPNLSEQRFESEAFGQKKGAYTDAPEKPGTIELADHSTLLIDEIGDLHPNVQGMFLKVLEDKKVKRMGEAVYREVNFRLISATNHDLKTMVENNQFRRDLYERIYGMEINIPPLRERPKDIRTMFEHYLHYYAEDWDREPPPYDDDFLEVLERYEWPGNVREVARLAARLVIQTGNEPLSRPDAEAILGTRIRNWNYRENLKACTNEFKVRFLKSALEYCNGNISKAADMIGVARPSLQRMLKELGIERK